MRLVQIDPMNGDAMQLTAVCTVAHREVRQIVSSVIACTALHTGPPRPTAQLELQDHRLRGGDNHSDPTLSLQ